MQGKTSIQEPAEREFPASLPIGARIRQLRDQRGFTQGDIEQKTGLMRCYISRVENGFKVPCLETLEKFAAALDLPLYRLFYSGSGAPPMSPPTARPSHQDFLQLTGKKGPEARFLRKLGSLWSQMGDLEHQVLFDVASRLAARGNKTAQEKCSPVQTPRKFKLVRMRRLMRGRGEWNRKELERTEGQPHGARARELKALSAPNS